MSLSLSLIARASQMADWPTLVSIANCSQVTLDIALTYNGRQQGQHCVQLRQNQISSQPKEEASQHTRELNGTNDNLARTLNFLGVCL